MQVGEAFIKLGLKGDDASAKRLVRVDGILKSLAKNALIMKATLIGAAYAINRLGQGSINQGVAIGKFTALTGQSSEMLQRWQYAARQFNVSAEEVTGSFSSLQQKAAEIKLKGPTGEFQAFANAIDFDYTRIDDLNYFMGKIREFAQSNVYSRDISNTILGQLVSPEMIGFLRQTKLDLDSIASSALLSEKAIQSRKNLRVAYDNLQFRVETSFGNILAKHGPTFIKIANDLLPKLIDVLNTIIPPLTALAKTFASDFLVGVKTLTEFSQSNDKLGMIGSGISGVWDVLKYNAINPMDREKAEKLVWDPMTTTFKAAPVINQTINTSSDPQKIGNDVGRATTNALRQSGIVQPQGVVR